MCFVIKYDHRQTSQKQNLLRLLTIMNRQHLQYEAALFLHAIYASYRIPFTGGFVSFSSGRLFRVATFELLVAHWGIWGDDLEHLYQNTCILWHGQRRRRVDGMVFASLTFCSQNLIYNIILLNVAIGFVTWLHAHRNWQLYVYTCMYIRYII